MLFTLCHAASKCFLLRSVTFELVPSFCVRKLFKELFPRGCPLRSSH